MISSWTPRNLAPPRLANPARPASATKPRDKAQLPLDGSPRMNEERARPMERAAAAEQTWAYSGFTTKSAAQTKRRKSRGDDQLRGRDLELECERSRA